MRRAPDFPSTTLAEHSDEQAHGYSTHKTLGKMEGIDG